MRSINYMDNITPEIVRKYKGRTLIQPNYKSHKKNGYCVEDINGLDDLRYFLGEVNDHEADLTKIGIDFLKEVFGLKELADLLYQNHWYPEELENSEAIYTWLKWWESEVEK